MAQADSRHPFDTGEMMYRCHKERAQGEWQHWDACSYLWAFNTDVNVETCTYEYQQNCRGKATFRYSLLEFTSGNQHDNIEHNLKCTVPVAKTPCSQCREPGFNSWSGNWIPCDTTKIWCSQVNKINIYIYIYIYFFFFFF